MTLPPITPEFLLVAIACGVGAATGAYLSARRNLRHVEFAFIVREIEGTQDMDRASLFEQLDLVDAIEQRNEVLNELATSNAGWLRRAVEEMRKVPIGTIGLAEDYRKLLLEGGLSEPRSPNSWGPLTLYLVKQGYLVPTGAWKPMRSAKSNGRVSREYRRVDPAVAA